MRIYTVLGHIFFAITAILAVYFYEERTIFIDSAFQIFKILNFETWNIEAGRYSAAITQILPLLLIKVGTPLNLVLLSYSLSFVLVFYLVFCLVTYKLKNEVAGICIVFILCLCIRQSFYHVATETHQGLVYTMLLYAWLCYSLNSSNKLIRYAIAALLVLLCYFSHPITLLPILFVFGYHVLDQNILREKGMYFLVLATIALFAFKVVATPAGSYEGDQFEQLGNIINLLPDLLSFSSTIFFAGNVNNLYYLALFILVIVLISYLRKKEKAKFWLVTGSVFFFMLITLITYNRGDSIVMMEKNFMPLTVFIIIPFANDVLSYTEVKHKLKVGFVGLSLIIGLVGIILTGSIFSDRLDYLNKMLVQGQSQSRKKTLVEKAEMDMDVILVTWAVAIETLLYSSLNSPEESATIFVADDLDKFTNSPGETNTYYATPGWRDWKISELNKNYFNLDNGVYQVITH